MRRFSGMMIGLLIVLFVLGCGDQGDNPRLNSELIQTRRFGAPGNQNDRQAVVYEAWYAMSGVPYVCGWKWYKNYRVSKWNYMASDMTAQRAMVNLFGNNAGWTAKDAPRNGYYQQLGRGGQCLFFVNLILYRSGADTRSIHASWSNIEANPKPIDSAKIGDIVFKPRSTGTPHIAIVVYRSGTTIGIIDSNGPVEPNPSAAPGYGEIISYYERTLSQLNDGGYKVYPGVDYYQY